MQLFICYFYCTHKVWWKRCKLFTETFLCFVLTQW